MPNPASASSTDSAVAVSRVGVGAIAVAVVAALLAVFALGVSLSTRNGTGVTSAAITDGPARPSTATISLTEFALTPTDVTVPLSAAFEVVNDGAGVHNLAVRDTDVATADLGPGASETLDLSSLSAGMYDIYCSIPGHGAAGMTGILTVTADADTAAADTLGGAHDMATTATAAAMQAEMEQAMAASIGAFPAETDGVGAARLDPTLLDDGTKLFELTVDEVDWEVEPGKVVEAVGYNGMVPGPTMNVAVGDRVIIRVNNQLDHEGTSLHPHGLKDHDFAIDGVTYISQEPIASGEAMDYTFVPTEEAVVTYHSHHMSLHQVPNGLFGALIVGDWAALSGFENVVAEEVMILNDAGNIGFSLNGKSFPATTPYQYQQGDRVVVHYANEGQMAHPMHLHNQRGTVIAKDGYLLSDQARYSGDTFNVAPGERLTVVYEMDNVGTWVWHCHILSHVKRTDGTMFGMLTAVIVTEPDGS